MSAELALMKLEAKVLERGNVGRWLSSIEQLKVLLALDDPDLIKFALSLGAPIVEAQAVAAMLDAYKLGALDAIGLAEDEGLESVSRKGRPSKAAAEPVVGIDKAGRVAMALARKLNAAGSSPQAVLAPIFAHANRVQGSVSDVINRSGNEGTTRIADELDLPTVWVAETTACVTCLAYSGKVAKPGKTFPGGLTYGKKSYYPDAIESPPRHPRCRCTVEPLFSQSYADALEREADRSVLRGFSLESESMGVRIDAAERLIKTNPDAPKSVIAFARASVKKGRFPTRGRP